MKDFKHPLFDEIYYYEKLKSTSKLAAKLIKEQTAQGNFLVISKVQSGGIGRNRNRWYSPEGGIWMTAALYGLSVPASLTIFTGICIHKILVENFPELADQLFIKWPNDIYLNNYKLCGILSSRMETEKYHLLGIGLNSNICELPSEMNDIAISLSKVLGREIDNKILITKIFDQIATDLPEFIEGKFDLPYFNQNSFLRGKEIILDTDFDQFSGKCKGINKNGALLIELKSGMIQPFYAGRVVDWNGSQD